MGTVSWRYVYGVVEFFRDVLLHAGVTQVREMALLGRDHTAVAATYRDLASDRPMTSSMLRSPSLASSSQLSSGRPDVPSCLLDLIGYDAMTTAKKNLRIHRGVEFALRVLALFGEGAENSGELARLVTGGPVDLTAISDYDAGSAAAVDVYDLSPEELRRELSITRIQVGVM